MASRIALLLLFLFPLVQCTTYGCSPNEISVSQTFTRVLSSDLDPEKLVLSWTVEIKNNCEDCDTTQLYMNCGDFQSVTPVDPGLFKVVQPGLCSVLGGEDISQQSTVRFAYTWKHMWPISVNSPVYWKDCF